MFSLTSTLFRILIAGLLALPVSAFAVTWTAEGPGEFEIIEDGKRVTFNYELDVSRSFGIFEWTLIGKGFQPDRHVFNWNYSGHHDYRQRETSITGPRGELLAQGSGLGAFDYSGKNLVIANPRRDNFVFTFWATNDDISKSLTGSFKIAAVPAPAPILMFSAALFVCANRLRRRRIPAA